MYMHRETKRESTNPKFQINNRSTHWGNKTLDHSKLQKSPNPNIGKVHQVAPKVPGATVPKFGFVDVWIFCCFGTSFVGCLERG